MNAASMQLQYATELLQMHVCIQTCVSITDHITADMQWKLHRVVHAAANTF